MKFKKYKLVRNIENPEDYELLELDLNFKDLMAEDSAAVWDYGFSVVAIWLVLCLMFGSILGFVYLIRTYF